MGILIRCLNVCASQYKEGFENETFSTLGTHRADFCKCFGVFRSCTAIIRDGTYSTDTT